MKSMMQIALKVLLPSWGELNVSLVAAILVIVIFGVVRHVERLREAAGGFFLSAVEDFGVDAAREKQDGRSKEVISLLQFLMHFLLGLLCIIITWPASIIIWKLIGAFAVDLFYETGCGKLTRVFYKDFWNSVFDICFTCGEQLELLAAKNLAAANLNGTSDPYAILTYGSQRRFSSLVPGSRNPMWGEEFDFYVDVLPAQISISIYDWDIIWKSTELGSTVLEVREEGQTEAIWHPLDGTSGQVCVQSYTRRIPASAVGSSVATGARRRQLESPSGTEVRQKPGPLQTIFELPPDEVVDHKFSCALERSFLYHGRMYLSAWHICFHSNVFAKQLKVVIPYDHLEEVQLADKEEPARFYKPCNYDHIESWYGRSGSSTTCKLRRAKYKFASFWNRNHAHRVLLRAVKHYQSIEEAKQETLLRIRSKKQKEEEREENSDVPFISKVDDSTPPEETKVVQPFVKDDVLAEIIEDVELPCTAEEFFSFVLSDKSDLTDKYRAARQDTELQVEKWHNPEEYSGLVRKITYRAICHSPMCPPDTAMTDTQHVYFSGNKQVLVFETIQQAHDVPFGSSFEVQARWTLETSGDGVSCNLSVKVGVNFKKRLFMASKIRSGAEAEYKADAMKFIEIIVKEGDDVKAKQHSSEASSSQTIEIPPVANPSS